MRRKNGRVIGIATAVAALGLLGTGGATAMTIGGGASMEAPGQMTAGERCMDVWAEIQATLVAGGGPKSSPVQAGSMLLTTGPTNCDHFWQFDVIGNGTQY